MANGIWTVLMFGISEVKNMVKKKQSKKKGKIHGDPIVELY